MQGIYNLKAFETVIAHFGAGLAKKKSNAEYFKEPLFCKKEDFESIGMTQEEIDNKEIQKMILYEDMWAKQLERKGLPKTEIKDGKVS